MKKKSRAKLRAYAADRRNFAAGIRDQYLALDLQPQRTGSGLGYVIHTPGEGPRPQPGQAVRVHYFGFLVSDGTVFDESFSRGKPFRFRLGQGEVIAGWDEGVDKLRVGDAATLFVPPRLGYGQQKSGPIPANSELMFYLEIVGVG